MEFTNFSEIFHALSSFFKGPIIIVLTVLALVLIRFWYLFLMKGFYASKEESSNRRRN